MEDTLLRNNAQNLFYCICALLRNVRSADKLLWLPEKDISRDKIGIG